MQSDRFRAPWPGFVTLTVLASVLVGCGSDGNETRDRITFKSETYGYTVGLPPGWTGLQARRLLQEHEPPYTAGYPPPTDVLSPKPNRTVRDMTLPALVVGAQEVRPGTALDEWSTIVRDVVAAQKGCEQPAEEQRTDVDGRPAVTLFYPGCPEGLNLFHLWTYVVVGNRGYHFVWFDSTGKEEAGQRQLSRILTNVTFLD